MLLNGTGNKAIAERTVLVPKNSRYMQLTNDTMIDPQPGHLSCYMSTMSLRMNCTSCRHKSLHAVRVSMPELRTGAKSDTNPLMRKDIFYSGNPLTLYECRSSTVVSPDQHSYADAETLGDNAREGTTFDALRLLLDFAVLRDVKFVVFAMSSVLWTSA